MRGAARPCAAGRPAMRCCTLSRFAGPRMPRLHTGWRLGSGSGLPLFGSQCTSEMPGAARPCAAGRPGRRPGTLTSSIRLHMPRLHTGNALAPMSGCHCAGSLCIFEIKSLYSPPGHAGCWLAPFLGAAKAESPSASLAGASRLLICIVCKAQASSNKLMAAGLGLAALLEHSKTRFIPSKRSSAS
jgi:hypothetical protein